MPATAGGAFVVIDRASRPMERMLRQAAKTDAMIRKLALDLDKIGTQQQLRRFDQQNQRLDTLARRSRAARVEQGNLGRSVQNTDRRFANLERRLGSSAALLARLRRESESSSKSFRRVGTDSDTVSRKLRTTESAGNKVVTMLGRLGGAAFGITKLFSAIKVPALVALIGAAAQAVVSLAGGVAALVPQLVGAVGVFASLIPVLAQLPRAGAAALPFLVGMGAAALTAKLAFSDLKEALSGNAEALKRLTPEGRSFLRVLKEYKPFINDLKQTAQRGLFPGLTGALTKLRAGAPVANQIVGDISRRLGAAANRAAGQVSEPGFLRDLSTVGAQGGRILTRLADAAMNVLQVLRQYAVAAGPFTEWLSKTVLGWTRMWAATAKANREMGVTQRRFNQTRSTLTTLFATVRNLWRLLRAFGQAISPVGQSLWKSAEKATRAWAKWAQTVEGQTRIRLWFDHAKESAQNVFGIVTDLLKILLGLGRAARSTGDSLWEAGRRTTQSWERAVNSFGGQVKLRRFFQEAGAGFREMARLVRDLGVGLFRLGDQRGFVGFVRELRSAIPGIVTFLRTVYDQFGRPVLTLILNLLDLFKILGGPAGPVRVFLNLLNGLLTAINSLISRSQLVAHALGAALSIALIGAAIGKVRALAGSWLGVAGAAGKAAQAESAAAGAAGMSRGSRVAMAGATLGSAYRIGGAGGLARSVLTPRNLLLGGGAAALGAAYQFGGGGVQNVISSTLGSAIGGAALGSFLPGGPLTTIAGGVIGGAYGLGKGLGQMFSTPPKATIQGDTTQEVLRGALKLDQVTVGHGNYGIPRYGSRPRGQINSLLNPQSTAKMAKSIEVLKIAQRFLVGGKNKEDQATIVLLKSEIEQRAAILGQMRQQERLAARIRQQVEETTARTRGRRVLADFGKAATTIERRQGSAAALTELTPRILAKLGQLHGTEQTFVARGVVSAAEKLKKTNPELIGLANKLQQGVKEKFDKMGRRIEIVNGKIRTGSAKEWRAISSKIGSEAHRAADEASAAFTQLQQQALGSLMAMGYTKAAAANIIGSAGAGVSPSGPGTTTMRAGGLSGGARGARVGGGGIAGSDTVPLSGVAAPGELIVNRHTESLANRMLGGRATLGGLVRGEKRPHGAPRYATGGVAGLAGLAPAMAEASRIESLRLPYVYGGGHVTPAPADGPFDCSSAVSRVMQAAGYGNPTMDSVGWRGWGQEGTGPITVAARGAGRSGHAYLVLNGRAWGTSTSNPGGGPGWIEGVGLRSGFEFRVPSGAPTGGPLVAQAIGLKAPQTALNGVPGALSQASMNAQTTGMTGALNSSVYGGILPGLARGGRVPFAGWAGDGASFTAKRPMLIGVGDGGEEHVKVTPRGGSRVALTKLADSIVIQNHRPGDIRAQLRDEILAALEDLGSSLDLLPDDSGLMR